MPGALPVFRRCVARSIYCAVKLVDRLESHPGALSSSWTLADVVRVKSLSALGKQPLLSRSDAMEFAVMGHCAGAVDLPVSLFRVCHPRRLECVKSIDSIVAYVSRLTCRIGRLLLCPCLRWFVLLNGREVDVHIRHPSRERRLCVHRGGCCSWRRPAASCSTSRKHRSGCWGTGVVDQQLPCSLV